MAIVYYKPNAKDKPIIDDIVSRITASLREWYGEGSRIRTEDPEIRSYRNCFIIRYPVTRADGGNKMVLVKIRRNPKMDSFWQAINADIHANIPTEYNSLEFVFNSLAGTQENFGVIRPLAHIAKYHAIIMEEYPSRTLRDILVRQRSSRNGESLNELRDAARKTGRWLHYFHHHVHEPSEQPYSTKDVLDEVQQYATRLETASHGRVSAKSIVDAFARKLKNVQIDSMRFSQSHADMTCDNVLYSYDNKVCIIDIKTRLAPIYSDLGLILIHPETFKPQIFSGGNYLRESLLKEYRTAIIAGYFEDEPVHEFFVKLYSAIKVLDKWLMYEELMYKYQGLKYLLSFPVGPFVTAYFQGVLKKHLDTIKASETSRVYGVPKPADTSTSKA